MDEVLRLYPSAPLTVSICLLMFVMFVCMCVYVCVYVYVYVYVCVWCVMCVRVSLNAMCASLNSIISFDII